MAKSLEEWMKEVNENPNFNEKDLSFIYEQYFFRDPYRSIIKQPDIFLASADGIIVANNIYDIREDYHYLKGAEIDIPTIIGNNEKFWNYLEKNSVSHVKIISIFMSFYNVHINRVPIDSKLISRTTQNPISSRNMPMLDVEDKLVHGIKNYHESIAGYWSDNERVCNYYSCLDYPLHYLVNQIADEDVRCICNFNDSSSEFSKQGVRLGMIRKGSQCDLILPILPNIAYEDLCELNTVVEAGIDPIVRVIHNNAIETKKYYKGE